jgi:hypothetical protein
MKPVWIALDCLVPHPLNANVMPARLKAKLAANIATSRRYPPLIVRRLADGLFQVVDGHQKADVLRQLGETGAWCCIWDVTDEEALLLLATLNRLEGQDVPAKRAALISQLETHKTLAELARLLPEDEGELQTTLQLLDLDVDGLIARLTEEGDRTAAAGRQLFSFAVNAEDGPTVEEAVNRAASSLSGRNRRGRALVILARRYLEEN